MRKHWMRAAAFLLAAVLLVGCGRGFTVEKELEERAREYVTALAERRLDDAKKMLTGGALQAAELSFSILELTDVRQKILSFEAKADPMSKNARRGFVMAVYTIETEVPGYEKKVETITAALDFVKVGDEWKISKVDIIGTDQEGGN